ncbi:uncharacterized protein LOC143955379 [Lithobates pipiens]
MPLGLQDGLCFFSSSAHIKVSPQTPKGTSSSSGSVALLAEEAVVSPSLAPQCESSYKGSLLPTAVNPGQDNPSILTKTGSLSMEVERRKFELLGCSQEVISTFLKARKPSTNAIYAKCGNLRDCKVEFKEEIKEEDDEDGVMEEFPKEHKDLYQDTMVESSSYRNPPERCPHPLYSRDSTQEGHTIPHCYKSGDPIDIEFEVKSEEEEERYVRDDQQSMEEDGITGTFIEEDTPTEISTGGSLTLNPFLHPYCSLIGPE